MRQRFLASVLVPLVALLALACGDGGAGLSPTASPTEDADGAAFSFDCQASARATAPDVAAFPADVTDSVGNTVRLETPPQRIVSLSAGHTETLYAMGAGDQVAAVDSTSDCPQATNDLPKVDAFTPSVEAIAGLEPDLVIIFFDPGELQSSLQGLGIPVLNLATPETVQGVYDQTALLGQATGHAGEATAVVADARAVVEDIQLRLADVSEGPRVFHEVDNSYFSAGSGTFIGDLYAILGVENIADATGEAYPQMSAEAIIKADPEVIILADVDAGESAESVKARPGWGSVSAVLNERIYTVDPDIVSRPGPRLAEALSTLAAYLYPELFP